MVATFLAVQSSSLMLHFRSRQAYMLEMFGSSTGRRDVFLGWRWRKRKREEDEVEKDENKTSPEEVAKSKGCNRSV